MHRFSLIVSVAALAFAAPLGAQQLGPSKVPDGHKPPPGMCRIWIDGVPPGRQAAPTDCPTAVRNRPSNGRVIWGDDDRRSTDKRDADRPTRGGDDRDRPRSAEEGERTRTRPSDPESARGSDRPRETRGQEKPRETSETPKTRETPRRESEERPRATPPRKADDKEKSRKPERSSSERRKPEFTRKPR